MLIFIKKILSTSVILIFLIQIGQFCPQFAFASFVIPNCSNSRHYQYYDSVFKTHQVNKASLNVPNSDQTPICCYNNHSYPEIITDNPNHDQNILDTNSTKIINTPLNLSAIEYPIINGPPDHYIYQFIDHKTIVKIE